MTPPPPLRTTGAQSCLLCRAIFAGERCPECARWFAFLRSTAWGRAALAREMEMWTRR